MQSEKGVGSVFTVSLPLTLAILDGQLVQVDEEVYIVPLVSVVESVLVSTQQVSIVAGKGRLFRFRDEYIPVISMRQIFGYDDAPMISSDNLMVVVEGGGLKAGLIVDVLQGQQQVVIKSLETHYKHINGFSGATILGNGKVALILDVAGLMKQSLDADFKRLIRRKNVEELREEAV